MKAKHMLPYPNERPLVIRYTVTIQLDIHSSVNEGKHSSRALNMVKTFCR